MAIHNELGKQGEGLAKDFLAKKGFKILEQNWRFGQNEIDIIAETKEELVIVEVKTRTRKDFYDIHIPNLVPRNKERFLINAANAYIQKKNMDKDCRFDLICLLKTEDGGFEIQHIEAAFYPRA